MSERIYFVVERAPGREFPAIYYDVLPDRLTRKGADLMVYAMRLDRLEDPEKWVCMELGELYRRYLFARDHGRLVHNLADPPRAKQEGGRILGEYWQPPVPTWDQSAPFVRPPVNPRFDFPTIEPGTQSSGSKRVLITMQHQAIRNL